MVAIHSSTLWESAAARPDWDARHAPVRAPDPPQPAYRRRASDAERAQHLTARMVMPLVAQVLAQSDGAPEAADPRNAAAAYSRSGGIGFEPVDLVAPV